VAYKYKYKFYWYWYNGIAQTVNIRPVFKVGRVGTQLEYR